MIHEDGQWTLVVVEYVFLAPGSVGLARPGRPIRRVSSTSVYLFSKDNNHHHHHHHYVHFFFLHIKVSFKKTRTKFISNQMKIN